MYPIELSRTRYSLAASLACGFVAGFTLRPGEYTVSALAAACGLLLLGVAWRAR